MFTHHLASLLAATAQLVGSIFFTTAGARLKLFLVDKSARGPTAKIMAIAAAAHSGGGHGALEINLEVVAPTDVEATGLRPTREQAVVFVSVPEVELSVRGKGVSGRRVACGSLSIAHVLARSDSRLPIFLVRPSDAPSFTAVDSAAALLAGIGAVVDERLLLHDGMLATLLAHRHSARRSRSLLLVGRSAQRVQQAKAMLDDWESELGGDGTLDPACWRACMALAQLDRLMPLRGPGDPYSFVKLARALNVQSANTCFRLSDSDLRKVLSNLATLWIRKSQDVAERVRLPDYARDHGFPRHQPVVPPFEDEAGPKRLYDAIKAAEFGTLAPVADVVPLLMVVPNRYFKHLPHVSAAD